MLTSDRHHRILERLSREGRVIAAELAQAFDTSEDTIRRDLRELARQGLLQRVHGGALPASPALADLGGRAAVSTGEKDVIGRVAATLIRPGQMVFLDGGTTTLQLVRHLNRRLPATIVTHSPVIAAALADHAAEVMLIGGRLYRHSMVAVGAAALEAIGRLRADAYVMGVTGIHPDIGLSTGDAEEAAVKRALIGAAAETIVLASPEKLGAASPHIIAPLRAATTLVTVQGPDVAPYAAAGLSIVRAPG